MKDIKEYLSEGLIMEASGKVVAFFNHESPDRTWLVIGAGPDMVKKINNYDFDVVDIPNKGNLIDITHSDEWGWHGVTDLGVKNENQLKSKVLNSIKKGLKNVEKNYAYISFDPIPFENEFEIYDDSEDYTKLTAEDWYRKLVDMYNDSYIDRDSSNARVVYDPNKKDIVFGGGMDIMCYTAEEFEDVLREWEEE